LKKKLSLTEDWQRFLSLQCICNCYSKTSDLCIELCRFCQLQWSLLLIVAWIVTHMS